MKYMGSKRAMLKNGLGELLIKEAQEYDRFVDLFTGAGFVAWFIAENVNKPVIAVDIQKYSTTLANSIIGRDSNIFPNELITSWIANAREKRDADPLWRQAIEQQSKYKNDVKEWVTAARSLCENESVIGPIWLAYGGHYFSPTQALTVDYLIANLPNSEPERTLCLAALISTASECVASPGHTAQPFQPTTTASRFILDAWSKDILKYSQKNLIALAARHAQVRGTVLTCDALSVVPQLTSKDLVFIDPPYSSVQYSRFYHVLETIAQEEKKVKITGVGRYPDLEKRPQSKYSNLSQATQAIEQLLRNIAKKSSTVIFTFPSGETSNGLSGDKIKEIAKKWFVVEDHSTIKGKFSTLGGNNSIRDARTTSNELIMLMKPISP
jgi:adenine-specific DNA methylase